MSQRAPRVAFFIGSFGGGGIERITTHLAHNFVKLGVKADLILNRGDPYSSLANTNSLGWLSRSLVSLNRD